MMKLRDEHYITDTAVLRPSIMEDIRTKCALLQMSVGLLVVQSIFAARIEYNLQTIGRPGASRPIPGPTTTASFLPSP